MTAIKVKTIAVNLWKRGGGGRERERERERDREKERERLQEGVAHTHIQVDELNSEHIARINK